MTFAKAQTPRHFADFLNAHALRDVVIINIATVPQALVQVHIAMAGMLPAMKAPPANLGIAPAINRFFRINQPGIKGRKRCHHLESGSGRISPLHSLALQRVQRIACQFAIIRHRNPAHEFIRVKGRHRSTGQKIAGFHIHHYGRGRFTGQTRLYVILQRRINRQLDIIARNTFTPVQFPDDPPARVNFITHVPRLAAQLLFQFVFHAGFTDLEFRDLKQRILILNARQIII